MRTAIKLLVLICMCGASCFSQSGGSGTGSSGGSGSGTGQTCGGLPLPCLRTDLNVVGFSALQTTFGATGNIGQPVMDPDFGSLFFRVTDSASITNLGFGCCIARNSGELEVFSQVESALQSNGGYNVHVQDGEGGDEIFGFDQKTFATCQYIHSAGGCATASGNGNPNGITSSGRITAWQAWSFSQIQPTVLYGNISSTPESLVKYDVYADSFYHTNGSTSTTPVAFVDFSACPNIPTILPVGYNGASYNGRQDRYFSAVLGGISQHYYIAAWWDTTTGNCYWQDTLHGLYGGSGISGIQHTTLGQLPTPLVPVSLTPSTGGGTVNVCAVVTVNSRAVTPGQASTSNQESVASPEIITATALSTDTITLTFGTYSNPYYLGTPGCDANTFIDTAPCRPYNVYMSSNASGSCSGTEVLQTPSPVSASAGHTYTSPVVSTLNGTSATTPPLTTNAGFTIHQGNSNQSGSTMILANDDNNSQLFLQPPNFGYPCPGGAVGAMPANSGCAGHAIPGYTEWNNNNGVIGSTSNGTAESIRLISAPTSPTSLLTCANIPGNCAYNPSTDQHSSWNDDVPGDRAPIEITNFFDSLAIPATFTNGSASIAATNSYQAGYTVQLTTSVGGTLPSGFSTLTTYYVSSTGLSGSHIELATTPLGTPIVAGAGASGTFTVQVVGNGSTGFDNACWSNQGQGWVQENLLQSTDGSGTAYRVGHHRSGTCYSPWSTAAAQFVGGGTPLGQISQDGKFIVFHSQMGGILGSSPVLCQNGTSWPSTGWQSSHQYAIGQCIWDGANYEVLTSISSVTPNAPCFISNAGSAPAWSGIDGTQLTDGGVANCTVNSVTYTAPTGTWTMNTGCTDAFSFAAGTGGESCRSDIFIAVVH